MKFHLAFLMVAALSGLVNIRASPVKVARGLNDDLQDFLALLPMEEITKIALDYLENDPEITEAIEYLESQAFRDVVQEVEDMKEARDVLAFLQDSGLDAYGFLNQIHELLGIPTFQPFKIVKRQISRASGGIPGLIADIKAILPVDDIKALYYEKLESSPAFARLIERLSSPEFQEFVDVVLAKEEAIVIIGKLKDHGVDLQAIADLVTAILGLHFPKPEQAIYAASKLEDELLEFVALLPAKKIKRIVVKHYMFDREFRRAYAYIRSVEFHKVVRKVHEIPEYSMILDSISEKGLDVEAGIKKIHEMINFSDNFMAESMIDSRSIASLIDEMKAVLPINEIKALYKHKLENSQAFRELVELISSETFQALTDTLFADEDFQDLLHKLQDHGVDLQAVSEFFFLVFGITTPSGIIDH